MWEPRPRLSREQAIAAYIGWSMLVIALAMFGLFAVWVVGVGA